MKVKGAIEAECGIVWITFELNGAGHVGLVEGGNLPQPFHKPTKPNERCFAMHRKSALNGVDVVAKWMIGIVFLHHLRQLVPCIAENGFENRLAHYGF